MLQAGAPTPLTSGRPAPESAVRDESHRAHPVTISKLPVRFFLTDRRPPMNAKTPHRLLRLDIDPVIQRAEHLAEQVRRDLPSHGGIIRAAQGIALAYDDLIGLARIVADAL